MKYIIVLSILTISLFLSCKSQKKAKETANVDIQKTQIDSKEMSQPAGRPMKVLEFKKGACHGTCPIYTMTFLSDGTVYYEGEQFSEKMGVHSLTISQKEIDDIMNRCQKEDFSRFPERYKSMIPDWASNTIIYYGGETPKSITWREEADHFLKSLAETIEAIEKRSGWKMEDSQRYSKNTITNEILAEIAPIVDAAKWIEHYKNYELKIIKKIAPSGNLYVLGFDEKKISPYEMLNLLIKDKSILRAQFNKKISSRE